MFPIVYKAELADRIKQLDIQAPLIARKAKPGHFVLVRAEEKGERIPLTIADSDADKGIIVLVVQEVGQTSRLIGSLNVGDVLLDVVGPLGKDREIHGPGRTIGCVAGGLGVAPMFPQTKAYYLAGNKVISIIGARSESLLFWLDRMKSFSNQLHIATDDGSAGRKAYAAQILEELIEQGEHFDEVVAIGPVPHMKAVTDVCKRHGVPVVVSLNPIMVDGTGMCGGCRVSVNGSVKYACVDGPEFDGAAVDFKELMDRLGMYKDIESGLNKEQAIERHDHACRLEELAVALETRAQERESSPNSFEDLTAAYLLKTVSRIVSGEGKFDEVAPGLTRLQAQMEAIRCRLCSNPTCREGCPVEIDIPGFIRAIQEDDLPRAARILKQKNNLPAVCGRVCPQETQCERVCVLAKYERPVAIGALERFVADWEAEHGVELPEAVPQKADRVAVIGSGPGGLTCAGDLARMGYQVTVFEAFHEAGGVLRYGIPEFRLPRTVLDRELNYLKALGVKIEVDVVVGKTVDLQDLFDQGYGAVFIGVGAGAPVFLNVPGENLVGVFSANELLTRVNLMKAHDARYATPVRVGKRIAVIGAGNVAMDAARTALRLGAETVTIVYRRSEAEMPARAAEIEHAKEEGVRFELLAAPVEILGDEKGRVTGLKCVRMKLGEPDDSGRRRPVPVPNSEFTIDCDMVIPALGTRANPLLTSSIPGLQLNKWGNIVVEPETCATSIPGVYAGGDIVSGAATVIEAMGAGKRAARAIDHYLRERQAKRS